MDEPSKIRDFSRLVDAIFRESSGLDPQIDFDAVLNDKELSLRKLIRDNIDTQMVLFDIGLQAIINLHDMFVEQQKEHGNQITYVVLSAKVSTTLIAIRKLLYSGLVDAVKCLNRPLIETIDLFYVCLISRDFESRYGNMPELYDNTAFWYENINRGKLKKDINDLFSFVESPSGFIEYYWQRRKDQQEFFSNSIHGSINSAYSNFMMVSIDLSDVSTDVFGKVTTAYPTLLLRLLEEINLLLQVFDKSLEKGLNTISGIEVAKYPVFFFNSHKFQDIYSEEWSGFHDQYRNIMETYDRWKQELQDEKSPESTEN